MSFRVPTLITAGMLGLGLSVGAVEHQEAVVDRASVDSTPSVYSQALVAASALRGAPASAAVGEPVSLEFITSLLRSASFASGPAAHSEWTLFLPIDSAFSPLAGARLDALIHDRAKLRSLLDAHIAAEPLTAADLGAGVQAKTLDGRTLKSAAGEGLSVNGATVLAEQVVGNGRVFIVDRLL